MRVIFYIKFHTSFGEKLQIIGNADSLGSNKSCIAMQYLNHEYWKLEADIDIANLPEQTISYKYVFTDANGDIIDEYHQPHKLVFKNDSSKIVKIYDSWNFAGTAANSFFTDPFKNILLPKHDIESTTFKKSDTHLFRIKAPMLSANQVVCLMGDGNTMRNWDTKNPILLQFDGEQWNTSLQIQEEQFPLAYKYGIYDKVQQTFVCYENGGNRVCFDPTQEGESAILQDGFLNFPDNSWKGAGVAIPVFSLRSNNGLGVGEFNDLMLLADWAAKVDLKIIQILPINDTTATHTWTDSYPYAAISAFALHPQYINLETVAGNKNTSLLVSLTEKREHLNELSQLDYEAVMQYKIATLTNLYKKDGKSCFKSKIYQSFFNANKHWLKPYASFCFLRDKYSSSNPEHWQEFANYTPEIVDQLFAEEDVLFYCFVQYHLHLQLSAAVAYVHSKGVILKGDIPIGVYRYGCDAWMSPALYKMDLQAGAPPDDFAIKGQNWGFPTYNWPQMQSDDFAWWRSRFLQMSLYFDAFRIDHILGFFRMWSIPIDEVQGIMGRFDPCLSITINEFGENGIWFDYERFCMPYITDEVLDETFGDSANIVKQQFLQKHGPFLYVMLPQYNTQRKIETYFKTESAHENKWLKDGLYDLVSNVILFEEEGSEKTKFHFRIGIDQTSSFRYLQQHIKDKLWGLYINYFYNRQNDFWKRESLKTLPQLKAATNMLVCGEDLGMVPDCVPGVMNQLGILSLEIQRMPKQQGAMFFNPSNAPYLSVVTPSTHDMSTLRGWWEEDKTIIQKFYNIELGQSGTAPYFCEPWINRAIVLQHLNAPAMWSIFQLQDILGMSAKLRRENPNDERINIPANSQHYWRYRMHLTLEQLLNEAAFNNELKSYIVNSGRG